MSPRTASGSPKKTFAELEPRWQKLCGQYLPLAPQDSMWRYSRDWRPDDPPQGWKLHLSATIFTAPDILTLVSPVLRKAGVLYKGPRSLLDLEKLNSGILGYSQIGKFLTVYPRSDDEGLELAEQLHRLTQGQRAPSIPFDAPYGAEGCVYYRYGSFDGTNTSAGRDAEVAAIRNPEGHLEEDCRDSAFKPDWVADPFVQNRAVPEPVATDSPLTSTCKVFRALAQRGRGGVYQAIDFSVTPPRICILKEGRSDGELDWHGRDGVWRIKNERRVLKALRTLGVNGPDVFSTFTADRNFFLTLEFIDGEDLGTWLQRQRRRISIRFGLRLGAELARTVSQIHAAGWVWRDCKPANLVIDSLGALRPIDFEGACLITRPDPLPWGTAPFIAPEAREIFQGKSRLPEDLYSLGAVIYFLLAGCPPCAPSPEPLKNLRKNVPTAVLKIISDLLSSDPERRPPAEAVARTLEKLSR